MTLEQWLPIPRKDPDFLEVEEQQQARARIEQFFKEKSLVTIDGQPITAQLSRVNFFGLDINDFALNAPPRRVNVAQARLGVILTFPATKAPSSVDVRWVDFQRACPIRSLDHHGRQ